MPQMPAGFVPDGFEPDARPAPTAHLSAAAAGTALPDTPDGRFEAAAGYTNPIGPQARAALTAPLIHPTGVDAVDSLSSPMNLLMTAAMSAKPAAQAAYQGLASLLGRLEPRVAADIAEHVVGIVSPRLGHAVGAVKALASVAAKSTVPAVEAAAGDAAPAAARSIAAATEPAAAPAVVRNLNDVTPTQARAQAVLQFNPSKTLAEVKATFTKLGETPLRAEASNAMELMRRGVPADEAVQRVIKLRAPSSAAEDLAARLGTPSTAAMRARVATRNISGGWTE